MTIPTKFPDKWRTNRVKDTIKANNRLQLNRFTKRIYLIGVHPFDSKKEKRIDAVLKLFNPTYVFHINSDYEDEETLKANFLKKLKSSFESEKDIDDICESSIKPTKILEEYRPIIIPYNNANPLYDFHLNRITRENLFYQSSYLKDKKPKKKQPKKILFEEFLDKEYNTFSQGKHEVKDEILTNQLNEFNEDLAHKLIQFYTESSDFTALIFADPLLTSGNYDSNLFTYAPFTNARFQLRDFYE